MDNKTHTGTTSQLERIAAALERIATAIENYPPRIIVNGSKGVIVNGNNDSVSSDNDEGNTAQIVGRDGRNTNDSDTKEIKGVQHGFNNNADEAIKNLTSALAIRHKQAPDH